MTSPQQREEEDGKRQRKLNYVPTTQKDYLQLTLPFKPKIQIYSKSGLISYGAYDTIFKNHSERSEIPLCDFLSSCFWFTPLCSSRSCFSQQLL